MDKRSDYPLKCDFVVLSGYCPDGDLCEIPAGSTLKPQLQAFSMPAIRLPIFLQYRKIHGMNFIIFRISIPIKIHFSSLDGIHEGNKPQDQAKITDNIPKPRKNRHPGIRVSGYQDIRVSGHPGISAYVPQGQTAPDTTIPP